MLVIILLYHIFKIPKNHKYKFKLSCIQLPLIQLKPHIFIFGNIDILNLHQSIKASDGAII